MTPARQIVLMSTVVLTSAASAVVLVDRLAASPSVPAATHAVLRPTAAMAASRAAHTATPLPDGRVLVAGGFLDRGSPVGAEIYDPRTSNFTASVPMIDTRHSHTATNLADGRVLIVGGYGAGTRTLASAELFDPQTGTFRRTGPLGAARADHVAIRLGNGKVLVAGGLGPGWTFLSSAELYDPASGTFTPTGAMAVARESHTAVALDDGRVLVVGGHVGRRANMVLHASAEVYDPATGSFTAVGRMGLRRHKHDAVRLRDGRVLVTGGADERDGDGVYDSTELFDPRTGTFTPGPRLLRPRYKHARTSLLLPDGRVLLAGGAAEAELFDPAANRFALVAGDARMAGLFAATAPLPAGGVLITGGYGRGQGPGAAAWIFEP